ncbi:hypothetical protein JCM31271_30550 [Halorubrum trueperi]
MRTDEGGEIFDCERGGCPLTVLGGVGRTRFRSCQKRDAEEVVRRFERLLGGRIDRQRGSGSLLVGKRGLDRGSPICKRIVCRTVTLHFW